MSKATMLPACLILALVVSHVSAETIYVNCDLTTGFNNGSSWSNAHRNFQNAIGRACSGDEVWVRISTCYPDIGSGITPDDQQDRLRLHANWCIKMHPTTMAAYPWQLSTTHKSDPGSRRSRDGVGD